MRNPMCRWLAGAFITGLSVNAAQALVITEYVEGSSNNKAIEITNFDPAVSSFSNVVLLVHRSGSTTPSVINVSTLGMPLNLPFGRSHVVYGTSANSVLSTAAMRTGNSFYASGASGSWFNGNDAVELKVGGSTGMTHDIFGVIGTYPVTAWTSGTMSSVDQSLRRSPSVCLGVTTSPASFNPSLQWISTMLTDDFSNLGMHTHTCMGGTTGPIATTISAVQGSGMRSTMVGQTVTVEGVVIGANQSFTGYFSDPPTYAYAPVVFIQTETPDADPLTSEGIAVHAGVLNPPVLPPTFCSPRPCTLMLPPGGFPVSPLSWDVATSSFGIAGSFPRLPLGALVRITGLVEEFRGDTRNLNCSMAAVEKCETRIRPTAVVVVRASGPLPAPVSIGAGIPASLTSADYFERFEGMRVTTGAGRFVSSPSKFFEDNAGPAISLDPNPSTVMARRLPSERAAYAVGVRNWLCRGRYDCAVPQTSASFPPNLAVGTVLNEVIGPMAYDYDLYRVVAQNPTWSVTAGMARGIPTPVPSANMGVMSADGEVIFGSINAEKAGLGDAPDNKITKLALTIKQMSCPNVVGVEEFQTPLSNVLTDRNAAIESLRAALMNVQCNYDVTFATHPDIGNTLQPRSNPLDRFGILMLVRQNAFGYTVNPATTYKESLQVCSPLGSSSAAMYDPLASSCPSGQYPLFSRRPILARFDGVFIKHQMARADGTFAELPTRSELSVIVTHFKSQLNAADDERRLAEITHIASIVRREHALGRQVVVMGDFNTGYSSSSRFLQPLRAEGLVNNWDVINQWQRFSYNFAGASGVLDHIMISRPLFDPVATTLAPMGATIRTGSLALNSDWPSNGSGIGGAPRSNLATWVDSPIGLSDHDPVWIKLGGYGLDPEFQRGLGTCVLNFVCAAFSGIGANSSACGMTRSGMQGLVFEEPEQKADKPEEVLNFEPAEGDSLEPYRLFRDKVLLNSKMGAQWSNTYYALSPALTDLIIQNPGVGMDVLALMYRFADPVERMALGQDYDANDVVGAVDIERLQRFYQLVLNKLDPKLLISLDGLPKPEELSQYEGQPSYVLIKAVLMRMGIF